MPVMPEMPDAPVAGKTVRPEDLEYVVRGTVLFNETEYAPGSRFKCADAAIIAQLRAAHALVLPNELESPEDVATARARLEAENADLQAQLDALRAQVEAGQADAGQPDAGDGGGKSKSKSA